MNNKYIANEFKLLAQLLEFHGENSFKIKAISNAARSIRNSVFEISSKSVEELSTIPGIGKSTALKIHEIVHEGGIKEMQSLLQQTPPSILPLFKIKGVGPKKIAIIWKELGIDSLPELWYACKEDKISKLKGFGSKTQEELKNVVEYTIENEGRYRFSDAEVVAENILAFLQENSKPDTLISLTGEIRRYCELVTSIDILLTASKDELITLIKQTTLFTDFSEATNYLECIHQSGIKVRLFTCKVSEFYTLLIETTGSEKHVAQLKTQLDKDISVLNSEEAIYKKAQLAFIPPELREGLNEIKLAAKGELPTLIELSDLKGSIHNHSVWSDGAFSIEDMAVYCRDILKLEYFGISDHSKTAIYANGLSVERVYEQRIEIQNLNQKLKPFHIFCGIESDILSNGSLDYPNEVLAEFDFVVASVHSQLTMDEKKATSRLIKAIENPYTTILGHPSGRQLLVRRGYPVNYKKVIDACAANGVVIEVNSNPLRLDISWEWIPYCLEKGVKLSINPDAHHTSELGYLKYGVLTARKGGLTAENCLNTLSLSEIKKWFEKKKTS